MKFVTNLWSVFDEEREDRTQTYTQHICLVFPGVIGHKNIVNNGTTNEYLSFKSILKVTLE